MDGTHYVIDCLACELDCGLEWTLQLQSEIFIIKYLYISVVN